MQQYCGCYSLLLHYMPKNVLFVTYSRSISQPHTRLTEMTLGRQVDIAVLQFTASYEADRLSFRCWLSYYSFNSQPHTRLTTAAPNNVPLKRPFNSQPHTRLTTCPSKKAKILNLSIHSLIRGWPCLHHRLSDTAKPFNSQPHTRLTRSCSDRRNVSGTFNSQPHTGLTNFFKVTFYFSCILSIHSLIRGWPYCPGRRSTMPMPFNSQPHTRLTMPHREQKPPVRSFNSQPHTRLTLRKC